MLAKLFFSLSFIHVLLQVVAPVRETCAQAVGLVAKWLTVEGVRGMVDVVLQLLGQQQWEVRHGGLLALKYILAVRQVSQQPYALDLNEKQLMWQQELIK
jgi:HEAT repeat protein